MYCPKCTDLRAKLATAEERVRELEGLIGVWYETGQGIILNPHQAHPDFIAAAEALRAAIGKELEPSQ